MLPKVSVCVPLYNGERYLAETLDSVVTQQGVDLEIIIGDDGSTDRSLEIARDYAQRYPHPKWSILSSGERLGMAGNWNACIQAATGDFVKVMGQDDLIYPAASASQAELLEKNPSVSLVVSGCDIIFSFFFHKSLLLFVTFLLKLSFLLLSDQSMFLRFCLLPLLKSHIIKSLFDFSFSYAIIALFKFLCKASCGSLK